jgi:hypothetical protein
VQGSLENWAWFLLTAILAVRYHTDNPILALF